MTIIVTIGNLIISLKPLQAQSNAGIDPILENFQIIFVPAGHENPPEDPPPSAGGAGSRGDCVATAIPLTALVGHEGFWDLTLTTQEYPTFWFYIPYTSEDVTSGEFSLQDSQGLEEYWSITFELPENSSQATPGIVSIKLPETVEPLETNRQYQWFLDLNCPTPDTISDERNTAASTYGVVERRTPSEVNSDLEAQLNAATHPLEMAVIYAENGIWFDALTQFAQVRLDYPDSESLNQEWRRLLTSVGFGNISDEPLSGSVDFSE
jgi:hypothetical protein